MFDPITLDPLDVYDYDDRSTDAAITAAIKLAWS